MARTHKQEAMCRRQGPARQLDQDEKNSSGELPPAAVLAKVGSGRDEYFRTLTSGYELSEQAVLRNRLLVAEQGLVGIRRQSRREEEARTLARSRTRDLEFAWATFLVRGMEHGHVPQADARLLTRAVLGLYNSIWHWYRPRGRLTLGEVADFYLRRQLAVLALPTNLADRKTG
ncbi:MAG: hypothetical protein ACXVUE_25120 [Solirubrobacteraceae bacterium]